MNFWKLTVHLSVNVGHASTCPVVLRPMPLLRLSLLRLADSTFPGNPLVTWESHPLRLRFRLSQTLWRSRILVGRLAVCPYSRTSERPPKATEVGEDVSRDGPRLEGRRLCDGSEGVRGLCSVRQTIVLKRGTLYRSCVGPPLGCTPNSHARLNVG